MQEASAQEVRGYYKQFARAKHLELKSWIDNEVFDLVDLRKFKPKNYATGRWILTKQTDKEGQTESRASTRPGFRTSCQITANKGWDLLHFDLKTVFLQRQSYDVNRDVVCQLPPEAGHPPKIAARLKKPDAPRRWWNILDKALRSYVMIPTRADRFCYVLYSLESRKQAWEHWIQGSIAQQNGTKDAFTESREQSEMEAAFEKTLDPVAGKKIRGRNHQSICG